MARHTDSEADLEGPQAANQHVVSARRDMFTGAVVMVAILLFIGTGGPVISDAVLSILGHSGRSDHLLVSAFLLNIALILFGWRRYRDLSIEVSERKAAEEKAQYLAATDPLTGFLNRRSLDDRTRELIAAAEAGSKSIAFMMLDLDNFKNVNDVHGHGAGDAVLKEVAERIKTIIPPTNLTARLGGDEFACAFLFDPACPEMVDRIADNLIEKISAPIVEGGNHLVVTTSIGISRFDFKADDVNLLMRRADIAMYGAKKQGRNRFCWFDSSMETELQTRTSLETSMRQGIPNGEFVPYFEQQIDLNTGKLTGFEMLARWKSPALGLVSPEVFIPIAEETGMIGDLSMGVMRRAMDAAKMWDPSLSLAVNISPFQLRDPWLAQKIVKLLVETGFPPERLEIEITESSLFENLSLAQSIVSSLKNQGINLSLDDFGTGFSSLAHLRALPFDRIKIDRSFVVTIFDNPESKAIVKAIVSLGESLNMPITAEGIEDKAIETELRNMGCDKGQGWYYGRPLSISQARAILEAGDLMAITDSSGDDNGQSAPAVDDRDQREAG